MDYIKNSLNNAVQGVVSTFKAPPTTEQFKNTGMLSPEEYVKAGDKLIQVSPQWQWSKAPNEKMVYKYLPADKQFLVLQDCPSSQRITDLKMNSEQITEVPTEDGWVIQEQFQKEKVIELNNNLNKIQIDEGKNLQEQEQKQNDKQQEQKEDANNDVIKVQQDEPEVEPEQRIYTIYVCYDAYYYCPRLYLSAIKESDDDDINGKPVKNEDIFEDIAAEKVNTTVTIENHPQMGLQMATIHPCKHAEVLKNFSDQIREGRSEDAVGAHLAILLFLKFFHDVVPTISFDTNFDIDFGDKQEQ